MFGLALMSALSQHNLPAPRLERRQKKAAAAAAKTLPLEQQQEEEVSKIFLFNPLGDFLEQCATRRTSVEEMPEAADLSEASSSSSEEFSVSSSEEDDDDVSAFDSLKQRTTQEPLSDRNACAPNCDPDSVRIFDQLALEMYDDYDEDDEDFGVPKKSSCVRFEEHVTIKAIPSHRDMDLETRERLWNNFDDIQYNGERNSLEFMSDGWDWRFCTEEEDFVYDEYSGELVHPTTWMELQLARQQILADYEQAQQMQMQQSMFECGNCEQQQQQQDYYISPPMKQKKGSGRKKKSRSNHSQRKHHRRCRSNALMNPVQHCVPSLTRFADT